MSRQVLLYSRPGVAGKVPRFFLTVQIPNLSVREGDWVRLPGWRTSFVRYPIEGIHTLMTYDLLPPPGDLYCLDLGQVTLDQGRWLKNRLREGVLVEIEAADPSFAPPGPTDVPPRLPRWLRWLEHDI